MNSSTLLSCCRSQSNIHSKEQQTSTDNQSLLESLATPRLSQSNSIRQFCPPPDRLAPADCTGRRTCTLIDEAVQRPVYPVSLSHSPPQMAATVRTQMSTSLIAKRLGQHTPLPCGAPVSTTEIESRNLPHFFSLHVHFQSFHYV